MYPGKAIRLNRLFDKKTHRTLIIPMDHGVTGGNITGLRSLTDAMEDMTKGGANAVIVHKGAFRLPVESDRDIGRILHLSASTELSPKQHAKVLVSTVEEALRLGADAVSLHVNLGNAEESRMLSDLGYVTETCERWGMPLLAMMYARGPGIDNEYAPDVVGHCARVGMELGADIVKIPYTGNAENFADIIRCCDIPVVIAGGPKSETLRQFLETAHAAITAGAAGLSVGRNVFQHSDRRRLVRVLGRMIRRGISVEESLALAEGKTTL